MAIFKETVFWIFSTLIAYSIGMLIYGTAKFISNDNADMISAFGSILGAVGSFFAIFVAIYIFHGWKVQKKYDLTKETSLSLLNTALSLNSSIENLLNLIRNHGVIRSADEFTFFDTHISEYSKDYITFAFELKSKNHLHRGLVRDFEKDQALFSFNDLSSINNLFSKISDIIIKISNNYNGVTGTTPFDLNNELSSIQPEIDIYSRLIKSKVITLNKECKPS